MNAVDVTDIYSSLRVHFLASLSNLVDSNLFAFGTCLSVGDSTEWVTAGDLCPS
jgi:hypothetical protein